MFDTEGYDLGLFLDIYKYQSVLWTNQKRSILSFIHVSAEHTFCEIIIHPKRVDVELTVMKAQSTGVGLIAKE
jgi:hypothetical protein